MAALRHEYRVITWDERGFGLTLGEIVDDIGGGGNKANRLLLTALAARGFDCHAVSRIAGDRHFLAQQFSAAGLAARGIAVTAEAANRMSYSYRGVQVEALELPAAAAITTKSSVSSLIPMLLKYLRTQKK